MANTEKKMMRRRLRNAWMSSIISISLVLLLVGVAALVLVNARSVSDWFKENMQVSVILREEVKEKDALALEKKLAALPYVRSTSFISREQGTAELQEMLGADFLSVFETSPVPISISLTLQADYVSSDSLAVIIPEISASPLVEEVDCQQSLIDTLNANLARVSLVFGVLIALLLFISFVLISNTVRLNVVARRFTISTMKLVGATKAFIRRPFLVGSVWQGLVSSLLALGCLAGLLAALRKSFPQLFAVFNTRGLAVVAARVVAGGVVICVASTWFVVGRLIRRSKHDLYY